MLETNGFNGNLLECKSISKTSFSLIIFLIHQAPNLTGSQNLLDTSSKPEGKFLLTKIEFGGSFSMSLEGDSHEVEVTLNMELLVTFGMSLEGVCNVLYSYFHYKLIPNLEVTKNSLKKPPL
jgi:hypothetical protein